MFDLAKHIVNQKAGKFEPDISPAETGRRSIILQSARLKCCKTVRCLMLGTSDLLSWELLSVIFFAFCTK